MDSAKSVEGLANEFTGMMNGICGCLTQLSVAYQDDYCSSDMFNRKYCVLCVNRVNEMFTANFS